MMRSLNFSFLLENVGVLLGWAKRGVPANVNNDAPMNLVKFMLDDMAS